VVKEGVVTSLQSELYKKGQFISDLEERLSTQDGALSSLRNEHFNVKAELYKFRLNPHSFKNTLASIKSVASKTHSLIRNLSGVLDYMLYDSNHTYVSLEEELAFAQEYFNLYREKSFANNNYSFVVTDKVEEDDLSERLVVPPLIMASFIENAFKHTDTNDPNSDIQVCIDLLPPRTLLFTTRNTFRVDKIEGKGGMGLADFNDRLELLYPNNFEYNNRVNGKWYECYLKINLEFRNNDK